MTIRADALRQIVKPPENNWDYQTVHRSGEYPRVLERAHSGEFPRAVGMSGAEIFSGENHNHACAFAEAALEGSVIEIAALQAEDVPVDIEVCPRLKLACQSLVQLFHEFRH